MMCPTAVPRGLCAPLLVLTVYSCYEMSQIFAFVPVPLSFRRYGSPLTPHYNNPILVPNSCLLASGSPLDKGFNLLETAGMFVPQGAIVKTSKEGWKFIWRRMMAELAPQSKTGSYERPSYSFDSFIGKSPQHPDEPNRYQIYLGNPCPWCHRVKLVLALRGITNDQVRVVTLLDRPEQASRGGWVLKSGSDPTYTSCRDLRQIYDRLSPSYTGRCTAPLLVDTHTNTIVSNESSDIVRMLELCQFGSSTATGRKNRIDLELFPINLREAIDTTNAWVYRDVNNGVYQCGFATTQEAYDEASARVRRGLQKCDDILATHPFLCGEKFTEADVRLLPTILRYDGAYAPLFRAGGAHSSIRGNYPHLFRWLKRSWNDVEGVSSSIDLTDACGSYYKQLFPLNPSGIVPSPVTATSLGLE